MMWFEDIEIGAKRDLGTYTFTEDEIIAFAQKYDPQIFHIDPEAAKNTMFGGLIASGWHTAAVWMKLHGRQPPRRQDGRHAKCAQRLARLRRHALDQAGASRHDFALFHGRSIEKIELEKSRPDLGLVKSRNEATRRKRRIGVELHRQGLYCTAGQKETAT